MDEVLKKVKTALRISHDKFDEHEIKPLIKAGELDLTLSGISIKKAQSTNDPLIIRAITLYVKAHFGLQNNDSEKYQKSYDMLKNHLTLSGDYNV